MIYCLLHLLFTIQKCSTIAMCLVLCRQVQNRIAQVSLLHTFTQKPHTHTRFHFKTPSKQSMYTEETHIYESLKQIAWLLLTHRSVYEPKHFTIPNLYIYFYRYLIKNVYLCECIVSVYWPPHACVCACVYVHLNMYARGDVCCLISRRCWFRCCAASFSYHFNQQTVPSRESCAIPAKKTY